MTTRAEAEETIVKTIVGAYAAGYKAAQEGRQVSREEVEGAAKERARALFDLVRSVPRNLLQIGAEAIDAVEELDRKFVDFFVDKLPALPSKKKGKR